MTTVHPDDGRLQAYLDGELDVDDANMVERHVLRCGACERRLGELQDAARTASAALGELDTGEEPDVGAALWEVRRRRGRSRVARHRGRLQAAAVVLLFAAGGAAAAMPGSPVRDWLAEPTSEEGQVVEPTAAEGSVALSVGASEGSARIDLRDVPSGASVQVRVEDREDVEVEAPAAAAFRTGPGWIRVVGGMPDGRLRLSLPQAVRVVEVSVEGELRVALRDGRLFVDGVERQAAAASAGEDEDGWVELSMEKGER